MCPILPQAHRQRYLEFQQSLEHLKTEVTQANLDGSALRNRLTELAEFFRQQIVTLNLDNQDNITLEQRVQAYHTEMSKQLRLLQTDVMFLQAARQTETAQKRQLQINDRLTMLMGYCDVLLQQESASEESG